MENLFIEAMLDSERTEIDNIKRNKAFAKTLANDLSKVFKINVEPHDYNSYCTIYVGKTGQKYEVPSFLATKDSVKFQMRVLGYRESTQFISLGELYEKYKETSKADKNFLGDGSGHGYVEFSINIPLENYTNVLRDIVKLFNKENYSKVF